MKTLNIVKADPAGNITAFVLNGEKLNDAEQQQAVNVLLGDETPGVEQVGFVYAPSPGAPDGALWRLTMAGKEFCGNAARSFGLLAAQKMGLRGRQTVNVLVSGAEGPVAVDVDCDTGEARAAIPPPYDGGGLRFDGKTLPFYRFQGISHIIACDIEPSATVFFRIKELFESQTDYQRDAFGVMFYERAKKFMRPAVYVYEPKTFVFETSCGSGSAALACHIFEGLPGGETQVSIPVEQPGGVITVRITGQDRIVKSLTIGGRVYLSQALIQISGG
jgi:diaminopimelate epimerase